MPDNDVVIIGPVIIDILAGPIGKDIFRTGSMPMNEIHMSYGGNAHNEAAVLSRFGARTALISKVGSDEAGNQLLRHLTQEGIDTKHVILQDGLTTGINVVLFDENGERRFLTNPAGSLRSMTEQDVMPGLDTNAKIVCFASMFTSPMIGIPEMERIFRKVKENGQILVLDTTKPKKGETLQDLQPVMPYVDYFLPNEEELQMLTGKETDSGAEEVLSAGAGCLVVKNGKQGCTIYTKGKTVQIGGYPTALAIDSTGAGDCFAAGFMYSLLKEMPLTECARFANAAASCCVEKVGATDGIKDIEEPMRRYLEMADFDR